MAAAAARPLGEVIDDLGVGSYQMLVVLFCSGLMLADGAMMLMISSIVGALDQELQAGEITRGLLVSTSFGGMLVGNLASGPLSSRHGRRWVCMASTLLLSFFGLVCSTVTTFRQLFMVQMCLGVAIGIGGPASVTLLTEVTPTKHRGAITNTANFAFMLGEVWTAIGLLLLMPDMKGPWRLLCIWGVLPALLVSPIGLLIHESPSWLQLRQRQQELRGLLVRIQRLHRKCDVNILDTGELLATLLPHIQKAVADAGISVELVEIVERKAAAQTPRDDDLDGILGHMSLSNLLSFIIARDEGFRIPLREKVEGILAFDDTKLIHV